MDSTRLPVPPFSCKLCNQWFGDFSQYQVHKKRHRLRYVTHWLRKSTLASSRPNKRKRLLDQGLFQRQKLFMYNAGGVAVTQLAVNNFDAGTSPLFSCKVCNRAFSAAIHLIRHERQAHNRASNGGAAASEKKRFHCRFCNRAHHNKADLAYHERSLHTGETEDYKCEICKSSFKRKVYLNRHMRIHNDIRPYVCKVCGKSFIKGGGLKEHERTHTGEKPYKCGTCNRGFSGRANLRRHEMTHSGEQPFECEVCGKRCNRIASLRQHMRIHTGERPYNCMHCNKSFPTCANLRRHERTHLAKKQFHCRQCGKEFTQKYTLKLHEMNHLGIRPHLCLLCGKTFMEKRKLKGHLVISHRIAPDQVGSETNSQEFTLDLALEGSKNVNIPEEIRAKVITDIEGAHVKTLEDFQAYWKAAYLDDPTTASSQSEYSGQLAKPVESASKLHAMLTTLPQNADNPVNHVLPTQIPSTVSMVAQIPSSVAMVTQIPSSVTMPTQIPSSVAMVTQIPSSVALPIQVPAINALSTQNLPTVGMPAHSPTTVANQVFTPYLSSVQMRQNISQLGNTSVRPVQNLPTELNSQVTTKSRGGNGHDSSGTKDYEHDLPKVDENANASSAQANNSTRQAPVQNSIFNRFDAAGAFNCLKCGQAFTSQIVLEIHMRTHQRSEFQSFCVQCSKAFNNILDLEDHIKAEHQGQSALKPAVPLPEPPSEMQSDGPFESFCVECNKSFTNSFELEQHIIQHEEQSANNGNNSTVNIPNHDSASSEQNLEINMDDPMAMMDGSPANAPNAPEPSSKKKKKKSSHEKKPKVYTCATCGKDYRKRSSLKKHMKIHDVGIIPVECVANTSSMQGYPTVESPKPEGEVVTAAGITPKAIQKVDEDADISIMGATDTSEVSDQYDSGLASDIQFDKRFPFNKKFECQICFMAFPMQEHLNGHMNKHRGYKYKVQSDEEESDSEKKFVCTVCDKGFSKQERLAGHMNKHKDYKVKVATMKEAMSEMKKVNCADGGERWQCPYCDKQLVKRAQLIEHLHDHVGVEPYTCEHCNKGFSKKSNYVSHQATHLHELNYECEHCHKKFKYTQSLKKHLVKCTKTYNCNQCGGTFRHKRSLNSHIWNVHTRVANCTCKVCGKVMASASGLREHELIHVGEKPYKCQVCERGFANRSNLRRHVMIHDNDRPFECDVCKMTFNRLASLQQHQRCHTGEKPYGCSICGIFFTSKSTRRKHEKRHTKKKDKKCKFCEKMFWDTYSCRMHERVHTGDLPFECTLCTKKFAERNVLMRHMRTFHKDWYEVNEGTLKDGNSQNNEDWDDQLEDLDNLDVKIKLEPLSDDDDEDRDEDGVDYHMSSDTEDEEGEDDDDDDDEDGTPQDMVVDLDGELGEDIGDGEIGDGSNGIENEADGLTV